MAILSLLMLALATVSLPHPPDRAAGAQAPEAICGRAVREFRHLVRLLCTAGDGRQWICEGGTVFGPGGGAELECAYYPAEAATPISVPAFTTCDTQTMTYFLDHRWYHMRINEC